MTYIDLLNDVKSRIYQAQIKANLAVNAEMLMLYWDIGRIIDLRQKEEGWGAGIIPQLARDIRNELPELKGFSERNLKRMLSFYREYRELSIVPQPVAQLAGTHSSGLVPRPVAQFDHAENLYELAFKLPWGHNIILMEKVKDWAARLWYMEQTINGGWSRDTLDMFIRSGAFNRQGHAANNFADQLPSPQSELAASLLKDPYYH
jgi:hypothetical protein